jgi:hypothetical protein
MWQRHNAQLANFDVTTLRVAAIATTQQADDQGICLNRSELKPQAHGRGYQFGSLTRIATGGNVLSWRADEKLSVFFRIESAIRLERSIDTSSVYIGTLHRRNFDDCH